MTSILINSTVLTSLRAELYQYYSDFQMTPHDIIDPELNIISVLMNNGIYIDNLNKNELAIGMEDSNYYLPTAHSSYQNTCKYLVDLLNEIIDI